MKNFTTIIFSILIPVAGFSFDCSNTKPFKPNGFQKVKVSVSKIFWDANQSQHFQDICDSTVTIRSFDVRNREEEAYYCLHPDQSEVIECKTEIDKSAGSVVVVPATWIRAKADISTREYRFHAYATQETNQNYLKDIYSRTQSKKLGLQELILEAALKTGSANADDGFLIKAEFTK